MKSSNPSFSGRLSENGVRSESERKFRRQGGKGKTTGGGSQCYVEDILVFPTRSTEFAADRNRRLLSDSLRGDPIRFTGFQEGESVFKKKFNEQCKFSKLKLSIKNDNC